MAQSPSVGVAVSGSPPAVTPRVAQQLVRACRATSTWPVGDSAVLVRGARPKDMAAVAALHGRCSPTTLLQRYRGGGRPPSLDLTSTLLRLPLCLVVVAPGHIGQTDPVRAGQPRVVALGWAGGWKDVALRAEMGLLVEDSWQGRGLGSALARRLGSTLRSLGYGHVTTRSATPTLPLHRVMEQLGSVRLVAGEREAVLMTRLQLSPVDALDPFATMTHV